ncbi:hypothetical protein KAX17_00135 [Candidatus Bipolaricaulota bacterium]|nr:hypothetical protein [Candidatus Bipolaricaulota bacterium]
MTKARKLIVGLLMVSLLAVGLVALAGNGFGGKETNDWAAARAAGDCSCDEERDTDGDGIPNCDDPDWTRPLDGSGYGRMQGNGQGLCDGSGNGRANGTRNGVCDGSGRGLHGSV